MDFAGAGELLGQPLLEAFLRGVAVWVSFPACPAHRECPECAPTLSCAACGPCGAEQAAGGTLWVACLVTFVGGVGVGLRLWGRAGLVRPAGEQQALPGPAALEDAARAQVLALRQRHARRGG